MIDYSQWGEQKFILEFFNGHPPGRFLDIGAFDGITGSNTRALSDLGWEGVCIEASPYNFPRLYDHHGTNDKVRCILGAFGPKNEVVTFFDARDQIGTVFPAHRVEEWVKRRYGVCCVTPGDIIRAHGKAWDFLSIDIEGAELAVVPAMGELLESTKLVCVEDTLPNCQFDQSYYDSVMKAWAAHGFTKVVGRTYTESKPANTLLAR